MMLEMLDVLLLLAIIIYIIFVFNTVKKDKIKTLIILIISLMLVGGSYRMADYDEYKSFYQMMRIVDSINSLEDVMIYSGYGHGDLGYLFTNLVCYELGFSFVEYRFVCFAIFLFVILWIGNKYTNYSWLILLLYFIYPLFMDGIQFRNTFVEVILLIAVCQLGNLKYRNIIIYILLMGVAATIHKIALIYIPFVIWIMLRRNNKGRFISQLLIIMGICTPLYADVILSKLDVIYLMFLEGGQYTSYFSELFGIRRYIAFVCVLLTALFTSYFYRNIRNKHEEDDYIFIFRELSLYLLAIAPIFVISRELSRVPRNILLLLYVFGCIYLQSYKDRHWRTCICLIAMIAVGIYGYIDFYMYEGHGIIWSVFNYNYFLDILK